MNDRAGHRGYIASRPVRGLTQPQKVQNLVVRDYAARRGLGYRLSATEYAMPGSYLVLESVLDELPSVDGVILYSLFMLPERFERRRRVYHRVLDAGRTLHAALEEIEIADNDDVARAEDLILADRFASSDLPEGL